MKTNNKSINNFSIKNFILFSLIPISETDTPYFLDESPINS